jgi:hypothetical protein
MAEAKKECDDLSFLRQDHTKRAKRRALAIMNAKNKKARKDNYLDLLKVTRKTIGYAQAATAELKTPVPFLI